MALTKLPNYFRTHRKRAYLSQNDVAYFLGGQNGSKICRYENFSRLPSPETIFAYEVLFKAPARELFAGVYNRVELATLKPAASLEQKLSDQKQTRITSRKIESLRKAVAVASHRLS